MHPTTFVYARVLNPSQALPRARPVPKAGPYFDRKRHHSLKKKDTPAAETRSRRNRPRAHATRVITRTAPVEPGHFSGMGAGMRPCPGP